MNKKQHTDKYDFTIHYTMYHTHKVESYYGIDRNIYERMSAIIMRDRIIKEIKNTLNYLQTRYSSISASITIFGKYNEPVADIQWFITTSNQYKRIYPIKNYKKLYPSTVLYFLERDENKVNAINMISTEMTEPIYDIIKWEAKLIMFIERKNNSKTYRDQIDLKTVLSDY